MTAKIASSCAIEHSKKRYSDLPEKPRSSTTVQIEKIPEKRPKERTALHLPLFHTVAAPSSSLKRRLRLFVDDNLVKKKRDRSRGTQAILKSCIDHIHAYGKQASHYYIAIQFDLT